MFNMELSTADHDGHAVVALHGELDLADAPAVASHLMTAVAAWGPSIIVDLADLTFIDCCGLGVGQAAAGLGLAPLAAAAL